MEHPRFHRSCLIRIWAFSRRTARSIHHGEPCANILPTHCPNWSGFWAKFKVCSGAARRAHHRNKSRNNRIYRAFDGGGCSPIEPVSLPAFGV